MGQRIQIHVAVANAVSQPCELSRGRQHAHFLLETYHLTYPIFFCFFSPLVSLLN